jgi:hypothetical protein
VLGHVTEAGQYAGHVVIGEGGVRFPGAVDVQQLLRDGHGVLRPGVRRQPRRGHRLLDAVRALAAMHGAVVGADPTAAARDYGARV